MKKIKIGLPRALLYHKYGVMWRHFFTKLGCKVIISSETNEEIIEKGINNTISTMCLPYKIYIGHILSLMDCDYILITRISNCKKTCHRFNEIYDNIKYLIPKEEILDYTIDYQKLLFPFIVYMKIGLKLTWDPIRTLYSYFYAKRKQRIYDTNKINEGKNQAQKDSKKVLILSHIYNLKDKYIMAYIKEYLKQNNIIPILSSSLDKKTALLFSEYSKIPLDLEETKEIIGAYYYYQHMVDGVILIKTSHCKEDELINELLIDKERDMPAESFYIDEKTNKAELETKIKLLTNAINAVNTNN